MTFSTSINSGKVPRAYT